MMQQKSTTDVRAIGKSVVLYTNDNRVLEHFWDCPKVLKKLRYEQTQGKKTVCTGVDLYFPIEDQKWLKSELKTLE